MTVRHRWHKRVAADVIEVSRPMQQMVRACVALGRRRQDWRAIGAAVGASSHRLSRAGERIALAVAPARAKRDPLVASLLPTHLEPAQRRMLEFGSCVVLSLLGLELQFGNWPAWTVLAGIGIYLCWVALYAEVTIQAKRRPALFQRWRWNRRRRLRGRSRLDATSASTPQPAKEERPA